MANKACAISAQYQKQPRGLQMRTYLRHLIILNSWNGELWVQTFMNKRKLVAGNECPNCYPVPPPHCKWVEPIDIFCLLFTFNMLLVTGSKINKSE